jgi:hypothetical protein
MKQFFFLLLTIISLNVHASYECEILLSHTEDDLVMASRTIHASEKDMKSALLEDFFLDHDMTSLDLKIFMSGWRGEEEISATVLKQSQGISEKLSVRGEDEGSIWFDTYKLKITCSLV